MHRGGRERNRRYNKPFWSEKEDCLGALHWMTGRSWWTLYQCIDSSMSKRGNPGVSSVFRCCNNLTSVLRPFDMIFSATLLALFILRRVFFHSLFTLLFPRFFQDHHHCPSQPISFIILSRRAPPICRRASAGRSGSGNWRAWAAGRGWGLGDFLFPAFPAYFLRVHVSP